MGTDPVQLPNQPGLRFSSVPALWSPVGETKIVIGSRVDVDSRRVHVNLTKDDIKNAPEFDESTYRNDAYRDDLAGYYMQRARGYRDMDAR